MLQLQNKSDVVIVAGVSGSGKSTFTIRHMLNAPLACRFVFDPRGEYAARLKMEACYTAEELHAAIPGGWIVFSPHQLYPGFDDNSEIAERAFFDFCKFAFAVSPGIAGQKCFYVTEAWQYCNPYKIPAPFARIAQDGRKNGLGLMIDTQRPNKLNESILNEAKEWVCFRLRGANALKCVSDYSWIDPDALPDLPDLAFVSEQVDYGRQVSGRLAF